MTRDYRVSKRTEFYSSGSVKVGYDVVNHNDSVSSRGMNKGSDITNAKSIEDLATKMVYFEVEQFRNLEWTEMGMQSSGTYPATLFEPLTHDEFMELGGALIVVRKEASK